jgi:hypothetical protein
MAQAVELKAQVQTPVLLKKYASISFSSEFLKCQLY